MGEGSSTHLVKCAQFNGWKKQFGLFIDPEGVGRCGGRLSNADVPYTRHPILLPRDHPLTELLVLKAHTRVFHNGIKETLTDYRGSNKVLDTQGEVASETDSLQVLCVQEI